MPQPKIQDELIAREIVINDADPSVRYKLTKRQTQEEVCMISFLLFFIFLFFCLFPWLDRLMKFTKMNTLAFITSLLILQIQKSTGAVVITR